MGHGDVVLAVVVLGGAAQSKRDLPAGDLPGRSTIGGRVRSYSGSHSE